MNLLHLLMIITFLAGLYFYAQYSQTGVVEEAMTNLDLKRRCPNILLQKGARFYLYNSKLAIIPGVNPISFDHLEDYTEFLEWQHSQGIRCPVLFLQQSYDTQGQEVYKMRPSALEPEGGTEPISPTLISKRPYRQNNTRLVNADQDQLPFNKNQYNSYDSTPYYLGKTTKLDEEDEHRQGLKKSPNPMDVNWGGAEYTQKLVDRGYYKNNEVKMFVP